MMILSDCYQVNLLIDHKPARLKIGFINFTAISEYYLLCPGPRTSLSYSLKLQMAENWRIGIVYQHSWGFDEIKLLSASSSGLSIISRGDIPTFAYNANFILVQQIYSSREEFFMFEMLQI